VSGKRLIGGFAAFVAVFTAALIYFQFYAYYEETGDITSITVQGVEVAVSDYKGLVATSSPLKLRGCFRLDPAVLPDVPAPGATPLIAPRRFACFDAEKLDKDIEAGLARAVLAAKNEPDGFDRILAVYPDGRAFMWRQFNEKYAGQ
jgi:hypothetical protein